MTFNAGDRVRITADARYCDGTHTVPTRHCGKPGIVLRGPDDQNDYTVQVDGMDEGSWVWVSEPSLERVYETPEPATDPRTAAHAVAAVDTSRPLTITDTDGDALRLLRATSGGNPPGTVAMLTARSSVYLTAADIEDLIAYLTALKS